MLSRNVGMELQIYAA